MKIKKIMYWCSLVMPIYDILKGVVMAISEIPDDVRKIHANRRVIEEYQRFWNEECYEDMPDEEFQAKYAKEQQLKKGKKKNG